MALNMEFPEFLLPEELVIEILSCLPVKSLVRFRCVSKPWNSLISDSQFVKLHLHRSYARNGDFAHMRLLIRCEIDNLGRAYASSRSVTSLLETSSGIEGSGDCVDGYHFIGTCNGLICLTKSDYQEGGYCFNSIRFWNPVTRLMSQNSPTLIGMYHHNFGFGYDCSSDTYKVVAMIPHTTTVDIYNMGDICWRTIQVSPLPPLLLRGRAVYVSNTLNWLACPDIVHKYYDDTDTDPYLIVSFDLGKENYTPHLSLPYRARHRENSVPALGVFRGCLCVSQNDRNTGNFVVWQMKEFGVHKSWTQLLNIIVYGKVSHWPHFLMCMSDSGDALLLQNYCGSQAVLYTRNDNKFERTMISSSIAGFFLNNYIESLVSPS